MSVNSGIIGKGSGLSFKLKAICCYFIFFAADLFFLFSAALTLPLCLISKRLWRKCVSFALRNTLKLCTIYIFPKIGVYRLREVCGLDRIYGAMGGKPERNLIFVANHTSWMDSFFMLALVPDAVIVLKKKYMRMPTICFLVAFFGFIALAGSPESARKAFEKSERSLREGRNVIIFPEGRRGAPNRLGGFGKLAFKLSRSTGMDVAPVAILSAKAFLARGSGFLSPSDNEFSIKFLAILKPGNFKNASEISDAAYTAISEIVRGRN